jgi:hypothetical protein
MKLYGAHPAIMHIRHTERPKASPGKDPCPELGLKLASFGAAPTLWRCRLCHTYIEKSKEKPLAIKIGLDINDVECTLAVMIPCFPV